MQFTYGSIKNLYTSLIQNGYEVATYHNWAEKKRPVILRHDIDYDMQKALNMARFECVGG